MKKIVLTQGKFALVDDVDFIWINKWRWYFDKTTGYARRKIKNKPIYMHREINKTPKGHITDHINRDKLDNRRINLKTTTQINNRRNHNLLKSNTSGLNGVSWSKIMKRWESYIWKNNKKITLGYFNTLELASLSRQEGEKQYWYD